jgi:hypothetical protein
MTVCVRVFPSAGVVKRNRRPVVFRICLNKRHFMRFFRLSRDCQLSSEKNSSGNAFYLVPVRGTIHRVWNCVNELGDSVAVANTHRQPLLGWRSDRFLAEYSKFYFQISFHFRFHLLPLLSFATGPTSRHDTKIFTFLCTSLRIDEGRQ